MRRTLTSSRGPLLLAALAVACGDNAIAPRPDAAVAPDAASGDQPDGATPTKLVSVYGVDGNTSDYSWAFSEPRSVAGFCTMLGESVPDEAFLDRLLAVDPALEDFIYVAETYDAVIVSALAAEIARASAGADVAPHINGVTAGGTKCTTFAACAALIAAGQDPDYDGVSGPLAFTDPGEPARASFIFLTYRDDNDLDWDNLQQVFVGDEADASTDHPAAPPRDTPVTGGPLVIGTLLPLTGGLAFLGPGEVAAARVAVAEINAAGGVNGMPVELVETDSGGDGDTAGAAATQLLGADADVIIGAVSSSQSLAIIDQVIDAGVVLFSPANTAAAFTTYADQGLYFRTAPSDLMQGSALADRILADGHRRVGILAIDDPYGETIAAALTSRLLAAGVAADDVTTRVHGFDDDFAQEATAMQAFAPDAIAIIGFGETADLIAALNELGIGPAR